MQTSPWPRPDVARHQGSWWASIGWYAAGCAATVATWMVVVATSGAVPPLAPYATNGVVLVAVVLASLWSRRLRGRDWLAWWLGIVTPAVLAVAAITVLFVSWAGSDWTF